MGAWTRVLLLMGCASLAACSSLWPRQEPQPIGIYTIDETSLVESADRPLCRALRVSALRSAPGYGSERMVYVRQPHKIEFFAFHKWADTPANMLYNLLLSGLEKSGRFGLVTPANGGGEGTPRLEAELLRLRQHFSGRNSRLELSVRARLFNSERIVDVRLFQIEEDAGEDPESGVEAANRAGQRLVDQVIGWLNETLPGSLPSCGSPLSALPHGNLVLRKGLDSQWARHDR